jgi:hypothetical protein
MPLLQITPANEIQVICSGFYRTAVHLCAQEKSNLLPGTTSFVSRHAEIISPINRGLDEIYGPLILHMLFALVHCRLADLVNGITN